MTLTPRYVRIGIPVWFELDGLIQMQPAVGINADPDYQFDVDAGWDQDIPVVYKPHPAPGVPFVGMIPARSVLEVDGADGDFVSVKAPAPYTAGFDVPLGSPDVTVVDGPAMAHVVELDWDAAQKVFPGQFDWLLDPNA